MYNSYHLIENIAIFTIPVLSAIIIHEVSHGYVAKLLGDQTAFFKGRLTLNPFKHIDIFGTIILPLICVWLNSLVFGWAKPVPVNYYNLKNLKRDPALVALAGPLSNFFMAILWTILTKVLIVALNFAYSQEKNFFISMSFAGIHINLFLMLFNLLPIPPLDGSKLVSSVLPYNVAMLYNSIENYGFIILLVLTYTKILPNILEFPLMWLLNLFLNTFGIS